MPIDFRISKFFHPGRILRLHRMLERTQWMPSNELAEHQNVLLRKTIERAATHVPYYRALFAESGIDPLSIRTTSDLQRLPLLEKRTLAQSPESLLADDRRVPKASWHATSGSTGTPVRFALDTDAQVLEFCYYWRHWSWAGFRLGDRFAELGSVFFVNRDCTNELSRWQPVLRRLMLNSTLISTANAAALSGAVRARRTRFLKGMASALYYFARAIEDAGIDVLPLRAVFSTGEVLTPGQREVMERVYQCKVLDSYGHMERTVAISQCEQGGYHVNSEYGVLGLENLRAARDGTRLGTVTGTSLHNRTMPLIRYVVGDDIELAGDSANCACGRTLPLVKAIRGRTQDTIVTPDGRFLTSAFVVFDYAVGIRQAQIHQTARDRVVLLIVPGEAWNEHEAQQLREIATRLLGRGMTIDLREVEDGDLLRDRSGKLRPVVGLAEEQLAPDA